jgi:hypothetical protein
MIDDCSVPPPPPPSCRKVSEVKLTTVLSQRAYLLFYSRKDAPPPPPPARPLPPSPSSTPPALRLAPNTPPPIAASTPPSYSPSAIPLASPRSPPPHPLSPRRKRSWRDFFASIRFIRPFARRKIAAAEAQWGAVAAPQMEAAPNGREGGGKSDFGGKTYGDADALLKGGQGVYSSDGGAEGGGADVRSFGVGRDSAGSARRRSEGSEAKARRMGGGAGSRTDEKSQGADGVGAHQPVPKQDVRGGGGGDFVQAV